MELAGKPTYKLTDSLLFLIATLLFLVLYFLTFRGFNGTDDMHYSLLSARRLQHRYDPFVPADVFCGRIALIWIQSFIYGLGGVNVLTTETGTLICTILTCWLVVFRLAGRPHPVKTLTTATLFYFAPTLVVAIRGIMPDAYVTLVLVLLFILWRRIFSREEKRSPLILSLLFGIVCAGTLLFKESAIVFIPFFVILSLIHYRTAALRFLFPMLAAAAATVTLFGLGYAHFTGNFFFRAAQIHGSQLIENNSPGSCNCRLDLPHLIDRLTLGPWVAFIHQGFLPALLPVFYLLLRVVTARSNRFLFSVAETAFLSLLVILLYFPANFQQYQPVCSDARQYLMLMPFGILVLSEPLFKLFTGTSGPGSERYLLPLAAGLLLCLAVWISPNKWKWLTYGLLLAGLLLPLIAGKRYGLLCSLCLLLLMAFTATERFFFQKSNWFNNLAAIHEKLNGAPAFFPDHDNYIQWTFLGKYREPETYNLELHPPEVYELYYARPSGFRPGWFILNRAYNIHGPEFFSAIDQLVQEHFFGDEITEGDVSAYRIGTQQQLDRIRSIVQQDGL